MRRRRRRRRRRCDDAETGTVRAFTPPVILVSLQSIIDGGGGVPNAAIHDTVAAITRAAAFQRSTRVSLMSRIFAWLSEWWIRLTHGLDGGDGRRIAATAAVVLIVLVLARLLYGRRLRDAASGRGRGARGRAADPRDHWREAQAHATAARFTEAAHALYAAVVGDLAARRVIRRHASKTSGDYARELRRAGHPAAPIFRDFSRRYEALVYGETRLGQADYAELLAAAVSALDAANARAA